MTERVIPGKNINHETGNGHKPNGRRHEWQPDKLQERILLHPHTVLHARLDEAGRLAFERLNEAGISFQLRIDLPANKDVYLAWGEVGPNPQSMHFQDGDEGEIFTGKQGIEDFIYVDNALTKAHEKAALERDPHAFDNGDPVYGAWVDSVKQRLRDKNRALMYPEETKQKA